MAPEMTKIHPLIVRIAHWINVLAVLIMITSGWRIYNADPLFDFAFLSGHFRRKLLPLSPLAVLRDVASALRGKLAHDDLSVYNAAQRAAYLALIVLLIVLVLTGLVLWKPVQFYWYGQFMGDYEGARFLHFFAMAGVGLIVAVHVAMVALVPRTFPSMFTGGVRRSA